MIKILLIDDAEDDYVITKAYISDIEDKKYTLDWINNFTEGLEEIKNQNHDIYLIDYVLGKKNGIELLQEAITFDCNKPMIILTGAGSQNIDIQAMEFGAYDYLVKNEMNPDYLDRSLRYALNAYKHREKIKESEKKFRYLFEQSNDAITISDQKGKLLNINQAGLDLYEYEEEEIYELDSSILYYDPKDQLKFQKLLAKNSFVIGFEFKIKTKNGHIRDVITYSTPIFNQNKELIYYQSITRDITEKKIAEQEIEDSLNRYQTLFDTAPIGIIVSRKNIILYANHNSAKLYGYDSDDEIVGLDMGVLFPEELRESQIRRDSRRLEGKQEPTSYDSTGLKKDGTHFLIHIEVNRIDLPDGPAILGFIQDITERQKAKADFEIIREQLYQAQKMEAIGRTTSGIAHDFNNLLTLITLDTETLIDKISHEDPILKDTNRIIDTVKTATALTKELLSFSRPRIHKAKLININDLISKYLSTIGTLIGKNIKQEIKFDKQIEEVYVDPIHMEQVLMNIILNATDAMPNGGLLTIETRNILPNTVLFQGLDRSQSLVEISISDTGVGMDDATLEKIFEPFFTTKEEGKGTGLGLGIVYRIIQQDNGFIDVKSELGKGTKISIYLPLRKSIDCIDQKNDILNQDAVGQILLIDNDDNIRKIIKDILKMNGFNVLVADDPFDALRVFQENKDEITLAICDVNLPNLSGSKLIKQISSIKSSLKVLYITGDRIKYAQISQNLGKGMNILQKPFNADTLVNSLKELLDIN